MEPQVSATTAIPDRLSKRVALLGKGDCCPLLQCGDSIQLAAKAMADSGAEFLPVVNARGRLAGVLSYRTIVGMVAHGNYQVDSPLSEHIDQDMLVVTDGEPLIDAMRSLLRGETRCVVVVQDGRPQGILDPSALLEHALP